MSQYIDTHSHLHFPVFDNDREEAVARMKGREVSTIAVGVSYDTSEGAVALAKQYPSEVVGATIGVHPTDTNEGFDPEKYKPLLCEEVVAVGECGLDYFRTDPLESYETQHAAFEAQINFAAENDLPLMLHVRPSKGSDDAHEDAIKLLREAQEKYGREKIRGTAHFFTGSLESAKQYWDMGFATSFPGVITFAKECEEVVRACPPELMLSETDAPYAAPKPHRGERNEPVYVIEVVKHIAALRNEDPEEVTERLISNAKRVFGVPK